MFYKKKVKVCAKCGRKYYSGGTYSKNNLGEICSPCGTIEYLESIYTGEALEKETQKVLDLYTSTGLTGWCE